MLEVEVLVDIKRGKHMKLILFLTLLISSMNANALLINTSVTKLANQQYQADYQIYNNTQTAVDGLIVYFQFGLFDNLILLHSPAEWDVFVAPAQDIFGLQEDGFADALALSSPLQVGETLNGLSLVFDWTGKSDFISTTQRFETYDANTFDVTTEGRYQLRFAQSVSAPASALFFIVLVGLLNILYKGHPGNSHLAKLSGKYPSKQAQGVAV
jgi:hypothetical protein